MEEEISTQAPPIGLGSHQILPQDFLTKATSTPQGNGLQIKNFLNE